MAGERRARNTEQLCRPSLLLVCLLEDELDVPFKGPLQREIDGGAGLFIIAGEHGNRFDIVGSSSIWF